MKKQELIHLHGLLAQVKDHYEEQEGCSIEVKKYKELGVQPTSIHKKRDEHKEAVWELARGIGREIENTESLEEVYRVDIENTSLSIDQAREVGESNNGIEYFESENYLEVSDEAIGNLDDLLDDELEVW